MEEEEDKTTILNYWIGALCCALVAVLALGACAYEGSRDRESRLQIMVETLMDEVDATKERMVHERKLGDIARDDLRICSGKLEAQEERAANTCHPGDDFVCAREFKGKCVGFKRCVE